MSDKLTRYVALRQSIFQKHEAILGSLLDITVLF